ncbi:MAG: hypothetical protein WC317_06590, partial [Candidatus Omnitrophota bacterium]
MGIFPVLLCFLGVFLLASPSDVYADTHYWQPDAGDSNWSDAANWWSAGGGIPSANDDVRFDVNGAGNCVIDVDTASLEWLDTTDYVGIIKQSGGTVTTTNDLSIKGGTWTTTNGRALSIGRDINIENGAVINLDNGQTVTVSNDMNITNGTLNANGSTIRVKRNWTSNGANAVFNCGTGTVISTVTDGDACGWKTKDTNPFYNLE